MLKIHNRDKIIGECIKGIHTSTKKYLNYDIHIMIEDKDVYRIKIRDPFLGKDKILTLHRNTTNVYRGSKDEYYMLEDNETDRQMYIVKKNIKNMSHFVHTELKFFVENI
jgi:hypothetical protein